MPAVGSARAAARRMYCSKNVRELALSAMIYHETYKVLPPGTSLRNSRRPWQGWLAKLLPYIEQQEMFIEIEQAYADDPRPFGSLSHPHLADSVYAFSCPEDSRTQQSLLAPRHGYAVGFSGFLGSAGINSDLKDGVLYGGSTIRFADIYDGLSQTILCGERPPSAGLDLGWWYAGVGTGEGALDHTLGLAEIHQSVYGGCQPKTRKFGQGNIRSECDAGHFWSLHQSGGHFALTDGSVSFFSYSGADVLVSLSTRDGGEIAAQ